MRRSLNPRRQLLVTGGAIALALGSACAPQAPSPSGSSGGGANPDLAAQAAGSRPTPPLIQDGEFNLEPSSRLTGWQQRWVDSTLATLSLRERIGQMVQVWVLADYANTQDSSFAELRRWIVDDGVGSATISLGSPIEAAAKINAMQALAKVPMQFASDLEPALGRLQGGVFTHYMIAAGGATEFPTAMAIAATGRDSDAYEVGKVIGREARAVGIDINFAPVVDVNNNPANPVINTRSFGEDPARVARLSAGFVKGSQEVGVFATAKHFPGHGDTDVDSHVGLPVVTADWARMQRVELVPFRAAIDAGVGLVMSAHIALPAIEGDSTTPATLSPHIITDVLRDTLGFEGLTITDALSMDGVGKGYTVEESAVLAVKAGTDILLKPDDPTRAINAVLAAVQRGEISEERIAASARRVLELKARSGIAFNPMVDLARLRQVVGAPAHRALAEDIATRAVTLVREQPGALPVGGRGTVVVQYMPETELRAGREFTTALRTVLPDVRIIALSPSSAQSQLDAARAQAERAERVVIAAYVRRMEGQGRPAIPVAVASTLDAIAKSRGARAVTIAFGNPYLLRQLPSAGTYLTTYSVGDASERAAAQAILGQAAITGRTPVSLPGYFKLGDGVQRPASR
ncbi:MAG TPA: glycoside hydrolase family 3 N-terminal domain-containing protein [Gemmatimonadaceae bacterium]|nr:glycoside hydrolase family 3 N-terminal domain-containing protein [Gemmatimonadaceae bacterium]